MYGFVQPIEKPMGYGKSVHDMVREIHMRTQNGELAADLSLEDIVDRHFYLPYADEKMRKLMRISAEETIEKYVTLHASDFGSIQYVEKDIEITLPGSIRIIGRIDLVKRLEGTTIVDFKTRRHENVPLTSEEQLRIYALGYKELTGEHADFIELYNLDEQNPHRKAVRESELLATKERVIDAANTIRSNNIEKRCEKTKCSACYLAHLCLSQEKKNEYNMEAKAN
jgi:DNA helicase-2/ATP-dependent DNA helicase PcrA